jgi:hypothetical protein
MTELEKRYEEALKQLQWKLKNVRAFNHEEVIWESILIVDKALDSKSKNEI